MLHALAPIALQGIMMVLRVRRVQAETARWKFRSFIDPSIASRTEGPWVDFPLLALPNVPLELPGTTLEESEATHKNRCPREPVCRVLELLELPPDLKALVPRRWERVGEVIILRLPSALKLFRYKIAQAFALGLRASTVVQEVGAVTGVERVPCIEILYGDSTVTVHRENGVRFHLDVAKVMFSSGNVAERTHMARVGRPGEMVVDLFAGIGYFTLPLAVHGGARVVACEINPQAVEFLRGNVRLNHVEERVAVLAGDCRRVAPRGLADRVILGYLWEGPRFLPTALLALRGTGVLHFHALERRTWPGEPWAQVAAAAAALGRRVHLIQRRRVKSYAPGVEHVVLDVAVGRPGMGE